jgi:Trk-type K+ transport system membrane component
MGLLGGLMIYLIENYSKLKNQQIEVSYINAWFVSCTCIYGCGLTTLDFAKLSKASQILLLVLTAIFGLTVSTIPALAIKAYTHKHIEGITVDNDHGKEVRNSEDNHQSSTSSITSPCWPPELERKLSLLPTPHQIRYWAYIIVIILILVTVVSMYLCFFVILGAWLDARYSGNKLAEGNTTINPWYASIIIVITGFNQNGLTPFSDGMARFVKDVYINIFVMTVFYLARKLELKPG